VQGQVRIVFLLPLLKSFLPFSLYDSSDFFKLIISPSGPGHIFTFYFIFGQGNYHCSI